MSEGAASLAWRPGVASGAQPERRSAREPLVARVLRAAVGFARVPARVGRTAVEEFAQDVARAGSGLAELSENRLDAEISDLRALLSKQGPLEALAPRSFAFVREVARRTLGTPHYDVQLFGGWVMTRQGLAELETGEGKTLTATLPAAFAALAGIPVHVITANDYLVERDAEAMRPLYDRLGLATGRVVEREPERQARRAAYAHDITYVTHKQVAFDYLQDRLAQASPEALSHKFAQRPAAAERAPVLRGLCFAIVDEADSVLVDEARTPLILSRSGAPPDAGTVRSALWLARSLDPSHYRVDRRRAEVEITDSGHARLGELAQSLAGPLASRRQRAQWVHRALCAERIFERDRHYLVKDGAIQIIDLPSGRRAPDRCFEGGVHSLIEAKEGVALTPERETVARISYQRFFRRYLRLAGMTGTAREVARELWNVYGLRTTTLPTRVPSRRRDLGLHVLPNADARWREVVRRIGELQREGRPVLVGTCSVETSQHLSALLEETGLSHQVLSARQDREEAQIVAQAGRARRITVSTRMAGRGTDIPLAAGVEECGGLAVVATELAEAGRIDRQLFGRCARQGANGTHEQWISLDDPLLERHLPSGLLSLLGSGLFRNGLAIGFTRWARRAEERRGALARRRLLESETMLEEQLAFSDRAE